MVTRSNCGPRRKRWASWWAVWLAIGETAFFIPVEVFELTEKFSSGMLIFFMLGGALRSAGDARTPMVLGIALTVLNISLNVILIRGFGPIPAFGTLGAALGSVILPLVPM